MITRIRTSVFHWTVCPGIRLHNLIGLCDPGLNSSLAFKTSSHRLEDWDDRDLFLSARRIFLFVEFVWCSFIWRSEQTLEGSVAFLSQSVIRKMLLSRRISEVFPGTTRIRLILASGVKAWVQLSSMKLGWEMWSGALLRGGDCRVIAPHLDPSLCVLRPSPISASADW